MYRHILAHEIIKFGVRLDLLPASGGCPVGSGEIKYGTFHSAANLYPTVRAGGIASQGRTRPRDNPGAVEGHGIIKKVLRPADYFSTEQPPDEGRLLDNRA